MKTILIGITMTVFLATTVSAQEPATKQKSNPPNVEEVFKKMDANQDGVLSKDEVKGRLAKDFVKIDADKDGLLSRAELEKKPSKRSSSKRKTDKTSMSPLLKMDTNKDGRLSKEEVKGPLANDFAAIDLNKDGFLSQEELDQAPRPQRKADGERGERGQRGER